MASYTDDFNAYADGPLANNAAWENLIGGGLEVFTNQVAEDPGAGFQASGVTTATATFGADGEAQVDIVTFANFDFCGVGYRCTTNNGYFAVAYDGAYKLYKVVAGTQTEIGTNATAPASGHKLKVTCTGTTITAELDTGAGFSQIISVTDSDLSSGQPGLYYDRQNSNASRMDNFSAVDSAGGGASITDVDTDETLEDGQTAVVSTHSGFATNPDSGKLVSGSFEYSLTNFSSNATTATGDIQDIANLSSSQAGVPFTSASHSLSMQLDNSVDVESASLAITLNPATGWAVQEVTGVNNAANACVTKNFTGTPPNTSQIAYETASNTSLNAQALLTTDIINGTINMRYWDAVTGLWEPFTVTLVNGAIASISARGGSVRSSIRNVIKSDIIDITR